MVNRKEFISRIFTKETVVDTIKSFRRVDPSALSEKNDFAESKALHIPELTGDMVYFEAMKLGIDPSNFTVEELEKRVLKEIAGPGKY